MVPVKIESISTLAIRVWARYALTFYVLLTIFQNFALVFIRAGAVIRIDMVFSF